MEEDLDWLLDRLREAWPTTRIILRTDSGFCREKIMATDRYGVRYRRVGWLRPRAVIGSPGSDYCHVSQAVSDRAEAPASLVVNYQWTCAKREFDKM